MSLIGSLEIMPLAELFQWAGTHGKTGVLEVCQGRIQVQFAFEDGRLKGCASNDPPTLLGQFLMAHGKIDEATLQEALLKQERSGGKLGKILVEMGVVAEDELDRYVRAKAEETIYRLFDWPRAEFRFDPVLQPMSTLVRLDLEVQDVLARGAERQAELETMRSVFNNPGMVLVRTSNPLQPETVTAPMVRRLYDLVDGVRTFDQVLLLSRAPRFLATKFLFELYRRGVVAIKQIQDAPPAPGSPEAACGLAQRLAARGEDEAAMDILQACQQDYPRHEGLQKASAKLEASYLDRTYERDLPATSIPSPRRGPDEVRDERLSSNELFVFEMIHEHPGDVRSLVRIAPLYEIDVIRALHSLKKRRLIDVKAGESEARESAAHVEAVLQSLTSEIEQSLGFLDCPAPESASSKTAQPELAPAAVGKG